MIFYYFQEEKKKELGKARAYILANTFEALIGALYLDSGYEPTEKFIKKYLIKNLSDIIKNGSYKDSKSHFQEKAQDIVGITPIYKVLKEWGPDHQKNFTVGVFLAEELVAEGEGSSKQEAEDQAAKEGLKIKNWKK